MKFSLTRDVVNELEQLKKKKPQTFKRVEKQLLYFQENSKHPSLRTHKLQGNLSNSWSISIEGDLRMLYYVEGDTAVFFMIGAHNEVYRK